MKQTFSIIACSCASAAGQMLPAPPNDLCENAQLIEIGQTLSGTTRGATWDNAPDYGSDGRPVYGTGVWYRLVGSGTPFIAWLTANAESWVNPYCGGCDYLGDSSGQCGHSDKEYLLLVADPYEIGFDFSIAITSRTEAACKEPEECVQPPNDHCDMAQLIHVGQRFQIQSNGATWDRPLWCPGMDWYQNGDPGVWYKVAGDGTRYHFEIEEADCYAGYVALYCDGCEMPGCVDYELNSPSRELSWCSRPGEEHLLYVETSSYCPVTAVITADEQPCDAPVLCHQSPPPPSNDWCPFAERIIGEGEFEFDLGSAVPAERGYPDVFFCWTAPTDGQYTLGTCGVTVAPVRFEIYAGCRCPDGERLVIDSLRGMSCGQQANTPFDAVAGQQYLIRIYSALPGLRGPGKFRITKGVPPQATCNLPTSPQLGNERCLGPGRWEALESTRGQVEVADDVMLADDFVGSLDGSNQRDALCWYGTYFDGGGECSRSSPDEFEVTYYADDCGIPAEIVAGPFSQAEGTLTVNGPALTGATLMDTLREHHYSAQHARVDLPANTTYWIKITNSADGDCRWHWEAAAWGKSFNPRFHYSTPYPDNGLWGGGWSYQDGRAGPLDGFDATDVRQNNMALCLSPQLRFELPEVCQPVPLTERCARLPVRSGGQWCHWDSPYAAPANDSCSSAEPFSDSVFVDTVGATADGRAVQDYQTPGSESACDYALGDEQIHQDVWYTYTSQCTGAVTLSLCGSDFDSKLAIYEDLTCPPRSPIACNDDACGADLGLDAEVSFHARRGREYRVRVGGYQGGAGTGTLAVRHAPPKAADLRHFSFLAECFTGPCTEEPCDPSPFGPPCCTGLDFDADGDIDTTDHQALVDVLAGP